MKQLIRLFKAVRVDSFYKNDRKYSKGLPYEKFAKMNYKTVRRGFVFSPEVVSFYSVDKLNELISTIEKELGLTPEQMNKSFHKSWSKVEDAPLEQLFFEQIAHYITTYGFEALGIYDEEYVYIPNEKLEIPEITEDIRLVVIKGITDDEIKEKIMNLLQSGIALHEDTLDDVIVVASFVGIGVKDIEKVKNKEAKCILYDKMGLVPEDPVEFLRFLLYKSIGKTLIIKNEVTIKAIKETDKKTINNIWELFNSYDETHSFKRLAEVFLRFKPLFLAFKLNRGLNKHINKIRKLANTYHKPMKEDFLNTITMRIERGKNIKLKDLKSELEKANIFRKIRLAYALNYRINDDVDSILYKVRNGKGYATDFYFKNKEYAKDVLSFVLESISNNLKENVRDKSIYIPENVVYALPATEKQFTGDFPSGSFITIPKDMVFGIYWENIGGYRVDLDLSLIDDMGKIGWDSSYRRRGGSKILFSGDMTDARKGASELFYVGTKGKSEHILFVNFYNFDSSIEVPYKLLVAEEQSTKKRKNHMVNPNNIKMITKSKITEKQKMLGLVTITPDNCTFYFSETNLGVGITASNVDFVKNARNYLRNFYKNMISLNLILSLAGANLVDSKDECDINLSPESIDKTKIIELLTKN